MVEYRVVSMNLKHSFSELELKLRFLALFSHSVLFGVLGSSEQTNINNKYSHIALCGQTCSKSFYIYFLMTTSRAMNYLAQSHTAIK